jgi:hypothetical protein
MYSLSKPGHSAFSSHVEHFSGKKRGSFVIGKIMASVFLKMKAASRVFGVV